MLPALQSGTMIAGSDRSSIIVKGTISFNEVEFDNCCIIVAVAATATLRGCTFSNSDVAIFASSQQVSVTMRQCKLRDCRHGVVVTDGAQVSVEGEVAVPEPCDARADRGGGPADTGTTFEGCGEAMFVVGPTSSLEVEGGWVTGGRGDCVTACQGGYLKLVDVNVAGSTEGVGVVLIGEGTKLDMHACKVSGHAQQGLKMSLMSVADIIASEFTDCDGYAVLVVGGALAVFTECCRFDRSLMGVMVAGDTAVAKLSQCSASYNHQFGMIALMGGTLVASKCDACYNGQNSPAASGSTPPPAGFSTSGNQSKATLVECSASFNTGQMGAGFNVVSGAKMVAYKCQAKRNQLAGVSVISTNESQSTGEFTLCTFGGSVHGVTAVGGAMVILENCSFCENTGEGVMVARGKASVHSGSAVGNRECGVCVKGDGAMASVCRLAVSGGKVGLMASEKGELSAVECTAEQNSHSGVEVNAGGKASIVSCQLNDNAGAGIDVRDEGHANVTFSRTSGIRKQGLELLVEVRWSLRIAKARMGHHMKWLYDRNVSASVACQSDLAGMGTLLQWFQHHRRPSGCGRVAV